MQLSKTYHIVHCVQSFYQLRFDTFIGSSRELTTKRITTSPRINISNMSEIHATITYYFPIENEKSRQTTFRISPPDIDLFRSNIVAYVIMTFIGAFVFFFGIFVFTYTYFKCYRKTTNGRVIRENQLHAEYKSLSFNEVEQESTVNLEPQRDLNADSSYLYPVFSGIEGGTNTFVEDGSICPDNSEHRQTFHQETTCIQKEMDVTQYEVQEHVYIEILENESEG